MKKWQLILLWGVILALILGSGTYLYYFRGHKASPVQNQSITQDHAETPVAVSPSSKTIYFPMTNFDSRITFRTFGQLVRPTDSVTPCGAPFSGYHDADDLEVTPNEVSADVPVYAIASGTVREISNVSGYGGLLVLGVDIQGQSYTVYYGHINLGSTKLVAGDSILAGERMANLGDQCSAQTAGERKHLHFAMHKGIGIDVRGYVPTQDELSSWIDPKEFLDQKQAAQP